MLNTGSQIPSHQVERETVPSVAFVFAFYIEFHRIRTVTYYKAEGYTIYFSNLNSNWITASILKNDLSYP